MTDLTKGGELKALFVFALPIFLGNLFEQLYNITDTVMVGNLLGAEALAAVGSSTQILALTISVSIGMSIGASVIISQLYGAKRNQNMKEVVDTNIIFISLFSFFLMVLGLLYSPVLLEHLNVPASLLSDADAYLQTILLDVIFIKFFTYGVVGAALATVLAQVFSFIVCLRYMYRYYPKLAPNLLHLKWKVSVLKTSLAIGLPAMLQQIFISLGFLVIQFLVNGFGANAIAAYTAASKVDAFAEMPAINLGQALMNFTAQNKGAGEQKRIAKGGRSALIITLGISIAISGLIYSFAPHFIAIFNRQKAIVQIGEGYLRIVSIFYFVFGAMQVLNGLLLGYGKSLLPLIASVTTFCLLQVPLAVCLSHTKLGFNGIWLAAPFGWFAGFLMRLIYFTNISKHIERKE